MVIFATEDVFGLVVINQTYIDRHLYWSNFFFFFLIMPPKQFQSLSSQDSPNSWSFHMKTNRKYFFIVNEECDENYSYSNYVETQT